MPLIPFTGVVAIATLRNNFDQQTAQLTANAIAGQKDQNRSMRVATLVDTTALSARTFAWTQTDDAEVRIFWLRVTDSGALGVVTATLTQDLGATEFLLDNTVTISVTSVVGTVDSRTVLATDYRTTTGPRFRLKRGVRYRITMAAAAGLTVDLAQCGVQLRSIRRAS